MKINKKPTDVSKHAKEIEGCTAELQAVIKAYQEYLQKHSVDDADPNTVLRFLDQYVRPEK